MNVESEFTVRSINHTPHFPSAFHGLENCTFGNLTGIDYFLELLKNLNCRRHTRNLSAVLCTIYLFVFICGLVFNLHVIAVVAWKRRMHSVTNFFIVNLAVADFLVCLCCVPATLLSNIFIPWVLSETSCKLLPFIQGVSIIASVLSLVAVHVDRYFAMCRPPSRSLSTRQSFAVIILIWLTAIIATIPWLYTFELTYLPETGQHSFCRENWSNPHHGQLYFVVVHLIFTFFVPGKVIIYCDHAVWKISAQAGSHNSEATTVRFLAIIFFVCYLPLYAVMFCVKFLGNQEYVSWQTTEILISIVQLLSSIHSCLNPLIYGIYNKMFLESLISFYCDLCCKWLLSCRPVRHSAVRTAQDASLPNPNTLTALSRNVQLQDVDVLQGQASAVIRGRFAQPCEVIPLIVITQPSPSRSDTTTYTTGENRNRNANDW